LEYDAAVSFWTNRLRGPRETIQRNYDSLNKGISGDFGYGWSLGITVGLQVSPKYDVTLTVAGHQTFLLVPLLLGQTLLSASKPFRSFCRFS
jgi:hypothetical protein